MRLLPKSEIQKAKATVQKQTIDEGKKIAVRIDRLREVASIEETKLELFRKKTIAKITEETNTVQTKLDELKTEVRDLEYRKEQALEPLVKEWQDIEDAKQYLDDRMESIHLKEFSVKEIEDKALKMYNDAKKIMVRAVTREEVTQTALENAHNAEKKAKSALKNASRLESEAVQLNKVMKEELTHRDMECAARERGVTMREEQLITRETELATAYRLLEDREATLQRQFNRSKK